MRMASEVMSSDSATERKIKVVEATSTSVREEDPSSIVKLGGGQELEIGSMSERNVLMSPSYDSVASGGFQECQDSGYLCGALISNEERVQITPLDLAGVEKKQALDVLEVGSSLNSEKLSDSEGKTVLGGVRKFDGCVGAESLLEVKKQQLLDELEVGSIFQNICPSNHSTERTLMTDNFPDISIKKFTNGVGEYLGSSLKVEVIDDTAVIDPIMSHEMVNAKKNNSKEDLEGQNVKRAKRRGKGKKTGSEKVESSARVVWKSGDGTKKVYSVAEMEALRFVGIGEQRKLWKDIYNGLGPTLAREYMSLVGSKHQHQAKRSYGPGILGDDHGKDGGANPVEQKSNETGNTKFPDSACGQRVSFEDEFTNAEEEERDEEDTGDNDEYYASIQRPVFMVEGEPNFEAGPPEDGLEYLRRVRWEAAQIPNVKVAKLDRSKLNKEQSVYMPVIPEIAKCPEHLMPSKEWEDEFLADFSKLRLAFAQAEASKLKASEKPHLKFILGGKNFSSELTALLNFKTQEAEDKMKPIPNTEIPSLSLLLSMDSLCRVSSLRKRITAFEAAAVLLRDECLWIFALCAAIDTPLHGDTSASFRDLLRKCASLRAQKEVVDDETIMLNILATISGRFFGQSDS